MLCEEQTLPLCSRGLHSHTAEQSSLGLANMEDWETCQKAIQTILSPSGQASTQIPCVANHQDFSMFLHGADA